MEPGFDTGLAVHAAGSTLAYAVAYKFTKGIDPIHPKFEMLAALLITIVLNLLAEVARGAGSMEALFPLVSSCTTGAMAAMMAHAALFKHKGLDLPPVEKFIEEAPPGYVEHVVRLAARSAGGATTPAAASALTQE